MRSGPARLRSIYQRVFEGLKLIDRSYMPNGGYTIDEYTGDAFKERHVPLVGEVIDRHGPSNGRYMSPVPVSGPFAYAQRSLPFVEDPYFYFQYEVIGDFEDIQGAFEKAPRDVAMKVEAYMEKWDLDWTTLHVQRGVIAPAFGQPGGAIQYDLPLPVNYLVGLEILTQIQGRES